METKLLQKKVVNRGYLLGLNITSIMDLTNRGFLNLC